jgi:hypothetical protein
MTPVPVIFAQHPVEKHLGNARPLPVAYGDNVHITNLDIGIIL